MYITAEEFCTLKLYDGEKYILTLMGTKTTEGTYTLDGDTMKLEYGGDTAYAKIEDDVITITSNGSSMEMKKK